MNKLFCSIFFITILGNILRGVGQCFLILWATLTLNKFKPS